jgi:hypothetical protein
MFEKVPSAQVDVVKILEGIRDGKWKGVVEQYRNTSNSKIKENLPCFTVGGVFNGSKDIKNLTSQSGLLSLDIDDFRGSRDDLYMLLYATLDLSLFSLFKSTGGRGYCALVHIKEYDSYDRFQRIYNSIYQELVEAGLDKISKFDWLPNLNRLRYVSYDPDIYIYEKVQAWINEKELPYKEVEVVSKGVSKKFSVGSNLSDQDKFEVVLSKFVEHFGDYGANGKPRHDFILSLARWCCRADIDERWLTSHLQANYHNPARPEIWSREVAKCVRDSYKSYAAERGNFTVSKQFSYDDVLKATNVEEVKEQIYLLIADKLNYCDYLKSEKKSSTFVEKEIKFMKKILNYL